jgi:mannosyl-3-phosphoglycerate phosphatase
VLRNRFLVVTDLDGTLLDHTTYALSAAREALDALAATAIPLTIATSKTHAEVRELAAEIGGHPILIVENGGALVVPAAHASQVDPAGAQHEGDDLVIELGIARDVLVSRLAAIAIETGASIRGFNDLSPADVSALTGLTLEASRLACDRHYDEPFLMDDGDRLPEVAAAAHRHGLLVTRGGRFFHLTGSATKGRALIELLDRFQRAGRQFITIGLGDAPNDLSFLSLVDRPVVMPRPDGDLDAALAAALPQAERAPAAGPEGWNLALLAILAGRRLAPVAGVLA